MSAIYNLEPAPTASVVISTNLGDLSVELFAKQTPLTCRNFLQLALDGYYDNTIFHRLIPGFILQGGDPTGTGNGGESIYDGGAFSDELDPWPMDQRHGLNAGPTGIGFRDEFHSRLKFNRRGLLGMANESKPDTNGSQFFFTLDKCEELTNKNTMFGRIVGDTIYNLAKMGESELEAGSERPTYAIKISGIEILVNPFEDMKKRERVAAHTTTTTSLPERKKKRKGGKQLLSFGDDEGDGDVPPVPKKKAKFDTRIAMEVEEEEPKEPKPRKRSKPKSHENSEKQQEKPATIATSSRDDSPPAKAALPPAKAPEKVKLEITSSPEPDLPRRKTALEKTNDEIAALKASMRRTFDTARVETTKKKSALENMIPETSIRGRKRRPGASSASAAPTKEDLSALNLLKAFQTRLESARPQHDPAAAPEAGSGTGDAKAGDGGAEDDEAQLCDLHFIAGCESCRAWGEQAQDDSDDDGWMGAALSFKADRLGKDLRFRKAAEDDLVVIDPLAKGKSIQEKRKADRDARSGKSGREWDQARNAKMAQASALAGRGAK
ncbi:peptidyl-prolyl isomerase CWC27 [Plectosphaerella cucumerina]|uniref:peptidylprolyl isomerase n=1 Tax=Plectosphaerella cucumerina TaxID=40658 RepID=A0A8K0TIE2_9PEZI|nr:peptidyl-prolyl isomerase CWC27 [Plectosphaerella cucumerina]